MSDYDTDLLAWSEEALGEPPTDNTNDPVC
jgi:hypothetical protein